MDTVDHNMIALIKTNDYKSVSGDLARLMIPGEKTKTYAAVLTEHPTVARLKYNILQEFDSPHDLVIWAGENCAAYNVTRLVLWRDRNRYVHPSPSKEM